MGGKPPGALTQAELVELSRMAESVLADPGITDVKRIEYENVLAGAQEALRGSLPQRTVDDVIALQEIAAQRLADPDLPESARIEWGRTRQRDLAEIGARLAEGTPAARKAIGDKIAAGYASEELGAEATSALDDLLADYGLSAKAPSGGRRRRPEPRARTFRSSARISPRPKRTPRRPAPSRRRSSGRTRYCGSRGSLTRPVRTRATRGRAPCLDRRRLSLRRRAFRRNPAEGIRVGVRGSGSRTAKEGTHPD